MKISVIAAMDKNQVIGYNHQLPWHLPADLQHFKQVTLGKPVIMGRKTFTSIGKPLPKRHNIVVTHNREFMAEGATIVHSIEDAFKAGGDVEEVMVIGGSTIFQSVMARADQMFLTIIDAHLKGDCYFPPWDKKQWQTIEQQFYPADPQNPYSFTFLTLERA